MTLEGAIAQLQELIDNDGIPFWAKPSLRKVMETVEMEREQRIEALQERKKGKWIAEEIGLRIYATKCSVCGTVLHKGHNFDSAQQYAEYVNGLAPYDKFCHECGAKMEVDE